MPSLAKLRDVMKPLRIIFAGSPIFAQVSLQALLASPHEVVMVLTQPDRPAGRGQTLQASPVKQLAEAANCPILQPTTLKDPTVQASLAALNADIMVVVAYGLLLPQAVLDIPRLGCLNVHASLLPNWRGAAPIQYAILSGDTVSGVSIMHMTAGLDEGPVYTKTQCDITSSMTSGDLHDVLAKQGADAICQVLEQAATSTLPIPRPQDETGATYASKLTKAMAELDWQASADQLDRQIRAFNPWPVAFSKLGETVLRIHRAEVASDATLSTQAHAGECLGVDAQGVLVMTGEGVLRLVDVQLPSKRVVSAVNWWQNYAHKNKVVLGPVT